MIHSESFILGGGNLFVCKALLAVVISEKVEQISEQKDEAKDALADIEAGVEISRLFL